MANAQELAQDISLHMCGEGKDACFRRQILRRLVDDLSWQYGSFYQETMDYMGVNGDTAFHVFKPLAIGMFTDFNWSRLISLYSLGGYITKHVYKPDKPGAYKFADDFGVLASLYVEPWVENHGGWSAFEDFFKTQEDIDTYVWRGLYTALLYLTSVAEKLFTSHDFRIL